MQNITPMLARKDESTPDEPRSSLPGGIIGFFAYWCALAIPFLLYGSNPCFSFSIPGRSSLHCCRCRC